MREDPSDVTDEDTGPAQALPPPGPPVPSFRLKNDADLFGLGLDETGPKESSEEGGYVWGHPLASLEPGDASHGPHPVIKGSSSKGQC